MLRTRIALALLTALAMALAGSRCHAQTVTVLTSFGNGSGGPSGSLTLSGSTLYGTTVLGGANGEGTVFSIPASGGSPTTLGSFSAAGAYNPYPNGDLLLSGTTLYGMSLNGGVGYGNVFSIPVTGGTPANVASFDGNEDEPHGGLTLVGSTLYGMTSYGGAYGDGTIFSVPVTGGTPTLLFSFNGTDGESPQRGLTLSATGRHFMG